MQTRKLSISIDTGSLAGQRFELETGFLSIGRGDSCSIRFDPLGERIASKQHAFIEARADGYYLTDNQSTNGTYLNGSPIFSNSLKDGDIIQFGKNGVSATVRIYDVQALPATDFRSAQIEHFQELAHAQPHSIQTSLVNFGLSNSAVIKVEPSNTGRYIGIGITLFAIAFMILIVSALMFLSVGPGVAIVSAVIAFVPAILYLFPILWLDRYDPEPLWLLGLAFAWGALVAVIVSFVINTVFGVAVGSIINPETGEAAGAIISAPIFEEASKGAGLLVLLIFFRKYFDDILDGIVFAGVIALGFATVENVLYYGRALGEGGPMALAIVFVLRGIMSPFAHVTFTAMTGIGCGIARETHNTAIKVIMPFVGYLAAVALHAIWNGMAVLGGTKGFLKMYFIGEIPLFIIFVVFSLLIMRRQNKILKEMLAIDVARNLITQENVDIATSAFRSSGWLIGGLFAGKFKARNRFLRAVGKLGLSYWHIQRATRAQGDTASFQQNPLLREEVLKWRDQV